MKAALRTAALFPLLLTVSAYAQDTGPQQIQSSNGKLTTQAGKTALTPEDTEAAHSLDSRLSVDPVSPDIGALPGGTTPSFGQKPTGLGDWRFDFHGFVRAPLVIGLNTRENPGPGQSDNVLHMPPVVPDDKETFSHTGVVPTPYIQLNFSIGNDTVTAHAHILAEQTSVSSAYFDPPSQAGINDAFLTFHPQLSKRLRLRTDVGAFSNRYGAMGEYNLGRYGTPLVARINGVGETTNVMVALNGELTLELEHGIAGTSNKAPADLTPELWNGFANANEGTSFANHLHAGLSYAERAALNLHYISAFSRDERATGTIAPDGSIRILAADLRLTLGRFGHFFGAFTHVKAENARTVGRIVEVLNARGGQGLIDNYFSRSTRQTPVGQSVGTGSLAIFGGQYDLSIGRLVSYPVPFYGDGPDIVVSVFGIGTKVKSDDARYDGVTKLKLGAEVSYSFLSWMAASFRYDRVDPDLDQSRYSFAVLSPRLIFRTDWQSTDQLVLGYSHWLNGSLVTPRTGSPPREDVTAIPDEDVISLTAAMSW